MATRLRVSLKRSTLKATKKQLESVKGLGLRQIGGSRDLINTPAVRGMIKQVLHLVTVEEID